MKWMKIAAIIGFLLFISSAVYLGYLAYQYIFSQEKNNSILGQQNSQSPLFITTNPSITLTILGVIIILLILFLYGIYRLGSYADCPLLRFGARWTIFSIILLILFILVIFLISLSIGSSQSPSIFNLLIWIFLFLSLIIIFIVLLQIIIFLGFIDISDTIKSGYFAGIFGLAGFVLSMVSILFSFSASFILFALAFTLSTFPLSLISLILSSLEILSYFAFALFLLFASLTLLKGSKKYESLNESAFRK